VGRRAAVALTPLRIIASRNLVMHPAYSVIFFTTAAGAGYGLLALLGVLSAAGALPPDRWFGLAGLAVALGAITFGLVSSTFHLGHPERSWRAFSQWRSSWLSREGVLALATYVPALALAYGWVIEADTAGAWAWAGMLVAAFAAATVCATGMIYATLKPIHAWSNRWVVPNYLALGLYTGAAWLLAIASAFGAADPLLPNVVGAALLIAFYFKRSYWRFIDATASAATPESATALGAFGKVRLLDPPNTQANYLQKEMGYAIARKHATKLRRLTFGILFALPFLLVLVAIDAAPWLATVASILIALSASAGVVIERWLFFAEARHTVMLYYGSERA
jgi:DMSO reductase anchor subunit